MEYTETSCASRSKQSQRMAAYRFCGALLDEKHRSGLFSTIALEKGLPRNIAGCFSFPSFVTMDFQFTAAENVWGG